MSATKDLSLLLRWSFVLIMIALSVVSVELMFRNSTKREMGVGQDSKKMKTKNYAKDPHSAVFNLLSRCNRIESASTKGTFPSESNVQSVSS